MRTSCPQYTELNLLEPYYPAGGNQRFRPLRRPHFPCRHQNYFMIIIHRKYLSAATVILLCQTRRSKRMGRVVIMPWLVVKKVSWPRISPRPAERQQFQKYQHLYSLRRHDRAAAVMSNLQKTALMFFPHFG